MRRTKAKKRQGILVWYGVFCLFVVLFAKQLVSLNPAFWVLAEAQARAETVAIMNRVITEHTRETPVALDIERDGNNRVMMVRPDLSQINHLTASCTKRIREEIKEASPLYADIPLGLVLRSFFFAAGGPKIRVRVLYPGVVTVQAIEQFESVGINQTRFVVGAKANVNARIVTLFEWKDIEVQTVYPIAEVLFSGEVPHYMGLPK